MKTLTIALLFLIFCLPIYAQTTATTSTAPVTQVSPVVVPQLQPPAAPQSIMSVLTSPDNLIPAAFLLSNIADAKTDWHFIGPLTHHEYNVTPAQRIGIAGGSIFAAYMLKHYFPNGRLSKFVDVTMGVATAYFAGRAYGNTFNHGTVTPEVPVTVTSPVFATPARFRQ